MKNRTKFVLLLFLSRRLNFYENAFFLLKLILVLISFYLLETEVLEAQAQYDFTARSSREVSFKKGDTIILFAQVF